MSKRIEIDKKTLERLYIKQNLSPYKIGALLNCSFSTITNRLNDYGIKLKSHAFARMKYAKKDFDGNEAIKAYMLGFRIGDLNVYQVSKNSETVVVRCHTTQKSQVRIIKRLFNRYGKVKISENSSGSIHVNCFLNSSFSFLLPKNELAWNWVKYDKNNASAFIAGYTDAEGNFILNQKRARFKIDSYDFSVLNWASDWLTKNGIPNKLRCICEKGSSSYLNGKTWNNDLWRLNINEAKSVKRFITVMTPFLMHSKRISDARVCIKNIEARKLYGSIK